MNPRTTIVLLVLLAAGVAVYLVVGSGPAPAPQDVGPVFPDFVAKDVSDLSWGVGNEMVRVHRAGDRFEVSVGESWDVAAAGKVEEVLSDLSSMLRRSRIEGSEVSAGDRQDYGLDPALGWIAFTLRGEERKILIGNDTMKRDTVYAQIAGAPDVLVVDDAAWKTVVPLRANGLRERRVLPFLVDDLDRITVRQGDAVRLSATRNEDHTWSATVPFTDHLDQTRFESNLFLAISRLETDEYVTEAATDEQLEEFGLKAPRYTVEVHRKDEADGTISLLIGKDVPGHDGLVYFKRGDRPGVSTGAGAGILGEIERDPEWFRDRNVTRIGWAAVEGIRFTAGDLSFAASTDHGEWHLTEPEIRVLDSAKVREFLDGLRDLAATGFLDDPDLAALGLDDPPIRLELLSAATNADDHGHGEDEGGEEEPAPPEPILTLLVSAAAEDGTYRAIRVGHEGTAYVIGPDLGKLLPRGFWSFVPATVFPDAPAKAEFVALRRTIGGEKQEVARSDDKWPEDVDAAALNSVLTRVLGLYAVRWVGAPAPEFGLGDDAFATVEVAFAPAEEGGAERRLCVVIGAETDGGRYARPVYDGEPGEGVFVLSPEDALRLTIPIR